MKPLRLLVPPARTHGLILLRSLEAGKLSALRAVLLALLARQVQAARAVHRHPVMPQVQATQSFLAALVELQMPLVVVALVAAVRVGLPA